MDELRGFRETLLRDQEKAHAVGGLQLDKHLLQNARLTVEVFVYVNQLGRGRLGSGDHCCPREQNSRRPFTNPKHMFPLSWLC